MASQAATETATKLKLDPPEALQPMTTAEASGLVPLKTEEVSELAAESQDAAAWLQDFRDLAAELQEREVVLSPEELSWVGDDRTTMPLKRTVLPPIANSSFPVGRRRVSIPGRRLTTSASLAAAIS